MPGVADPAAIRHLLQQMAISLFEFQMFKTICIASSIGYTVVNLAFKAKRLAAMRPPPLPSPVPQSPEQIQQRIDEIRSLAATRFQLAKSSLTEAVRLNQDLRIPRSELFDFIEDLEERFRLVAPRSQTTSVTTFSDLTALFISAAPNDR